MSDDSVADDELASFIDRILRMKAEEDAIKSDIKEIYAEAKGRGYDKTRLGETVMKVRKLEKDADGEAEKEAVRDLYLTAYFRAKNKPHAHAYARGAVLTRTQTQVAPQPASDLTAPQPLGQVADIQPAMVEQAQEPMDVEPSDPQRSGSVTREDAALLAPEPTNAGSSNGRTAEFDSVNAGSTPAPASTVTTFTPKPLRPYCQNPGNGCGGMGKKHCWKCEKAHDEAQGAA